ncbi:MAG: hypothetical protein WAV38_14490 [Xanthobacteraceae bacterium]|jgi:hypothetical protein
MRTLARSALALSFIGATAIGTIATAQAQGIYFGFGYPHPYYHHYYYRQYPRYYGYYNFGYAHPYYHHYRHYPSYYGYRRRLNT